MYDNNIFFPYIIIFSLYNHFFRPKNHFIHPFTLGAWPCLFWSVFAIKKTNFFKIDLKRYIWVYLSIRLVRKWNFMAIALVKSQFGPTSTQNLQFLTFFHLFLGILALPGQPIAIPYSLSLFPFHSPCPCPIGSCQGL